MSASIPRYLIENHGPDHEAIKTAFGGAFKVCVQNGITSITLLVPSKSAFPSTAVGAFLGERAAKALCKGETVKIDTNLAMNLESIKTFSPHQSYGMVIGVYLSQKDQNVLDSVSSTKAIVLLPWTEEEGNEWLSTWNATTLGKSTWQVQQTTFPQDVDRALLNLTHRINLSTGLSHPLDKKAAQETLSEIKHGGHQLDPGDIRKWALRNNWRPVDAEDLGKLAAQYFR